ncbi:MAG: ABC transporter substrate-binding protein [Rhodospirillaceae bacterium]|nr:ABC transporter substrate-binding protein [Rhodospirillaceae bacterium]
MVKDAAGREHYQAGSSARIVSLVPSLTELLFDLDLVQQLVGRTSSCVEPAGRLDQIDGLGTTNKVDIMKLAELGPSHVLVNKDQTPEALTQEIINLGVEIVLTHCEGPDDVVTLFELIGNIFARDEQAGNMIEALQREITTTKQAAAERDTKRVIFLTWKNPWVTVSQNTFTANVLAMAGMETLGHNPDRRFPDIDIDRALLEQTDLVLFGNEPFQFEDEDVDEFRLSNGIGSRPYLEIVDGRSLAWPGRRTVQGLQELSQLAARL